MFLDKLRTQHAGLTFTLSAITKVATQAYETKAEEDGQNNAEYYSQLSVVSFQRARNDEMNFSFEPSFEVSTHYPNAFSLGIHTVVPQIQACSYT
jgi:hypothetical protein